MITTNKKSIIDSHTHKRKESKHNTKDNHQITEKRAKEEEKNKKELQNNPKTINKMVISTYLSIITLNVNALIKIHRVVNGYKNKTYLYAACKRLTSDLNIHTN